MTTYKPKESESALAPREGFGGLLRRGVVQEIPALTAMESRVQMCIGLGRPVKLIYGETFDGTNTLDSVRAYLTFSSLVELLKRRGAKVDATLLICDANESLERKDPKLEKQAAERKEFAEMIKQVYGCSFNVVLQSANMEKNPNALGQLGGCLSHGDLLNAVPHDKRQEAIANNFKYIELELNEIVKYDIKMGPPRERLYDNLARDTAFLCRIPELIPVYLSMTYPLGLRFEEYVDHKDMLSYGLTPYRSLGRFKRNRIVMDGTERDRLGGLIEKTEVSKVERMPNPLLPLLIMSEELAKNHLENRVGMPSDLYGRFYHPERGEGISVAELKKATEKSVREHVLDVLKR
ncbi:MAG TPA: hypothetical protein VMV00_02950 [Candidatus Baltobacteraceae bacterium]|nr:hypothetical protein [Candidatus Baltobacteraceae bacterium]